MIIAGLILYTVPTGAEQPKDLQHSQPINLLLKHQPYLLASQVQLGWQNSMHGTHHYHQVTLGLAKSAVKIAQPSGNRYFAVLM